MLYSYANLQQKSCLRAFKNASPHSGVWKGNSRDPQFGQNIVRDLRNVNVKRNFTATGLETGLRKFGQGCEMWKENANIRDSDDRSSGCGILGKKKRVQDPALQTLYIGDN